MESFSTLVQLLHSRAQQQAQQTAYTFLADGEIPTNSLTYAALERRAQSIAAHLQTLNATGERALLLYPPGLEYIAAFWGCLYAGVIAVPAYPPHPKRPMTRLKVIADDAGAKFALTESTLSDKLALSDYAQADLAGVMWVATDTIALELADQWLPPALAADSLAFLQYTSGSTSTPKGVMISHANLLWTLEDLHRAWDHTSASVMVSWLPIFHDLGLIYGILTPLYVGFPCYFMPPIAFLEKPARWLQVMTRYGATHTAAPNFAYELCVRKTSPEQKAGLDLCALRMALNAAEPIRNDTLTAFSSTFAPHGFNPAAFCPGYGLAEASVKVSAEPLGRGPQSLALESDALEQHRVVLAAHPATARTIIGCGGSAIGADIRIVNPETQITSAPRAIGEIWVKSLSVAQGYWNRPEATRETFQAYLADTGDGPFLRTGDLGFYENDELYITGRLKDLLIIRGRNHYPHDIELTVERAHPALRAGCGAAFSISVAGEERVVVFQELERTAVRDFDAEAIFAAIRQAVAEEHELQLQAIVLLRTGAVPKTSSGKIQRQASKKMFLADETAEAPDWRLAEWQIPLSAPPLPLQEVPSATNAETILIQWMMQWFSQKLRLPLATFTPNKTFASLGVDSITAVEFVQALEEGPLLGYALETTLLWNYATLGSLARHLVTEVQAASSPPKPAKATAPPTPIADNLDALSEAELVQLLAQELNSPVSNP